MNPPARRLRVPVACCLAAASLPLFAILFRQIAPHTPTDIVQHWVAARALLAGEDPYEAVLAWGWTYPYYYPLPAALVALPLTVLSIPGARLLFTGVSVGVLAYGLTATAWWPLLWLLGGPALQGFGVAQWSPLLTAAVTLPATQALWLVKPTTGLALAAGYGIRRPGALIAALLLMVSLAWMPEWPLAWWRAVSSPHPHILPPVARPGGILLLLALLRWRRPEGRLVAALALVPQTGALYELVPLGLVPGSRREMMLLTATSQMALLALRPNSAFESLAQAYAAAWPVVLGLVYLPALVLVLRRPNQAPGRVANAEISSP